MNLRTYASGLTPVVALAVWVGTSAGPAPAQEVPAAVRSFSLADRLSVILTTDWVERRNEDPPPPNQLIASAPRFNFSEILVLENRKAHAVLKVAISENPFLGGNAPSLEARIHAAGGSALVNHLFYFFFPPPRTCLAEAKSVLEAARREEEARRENEKKERRAPKAISISRSCEFAATPLDFYSEQVSSGVTLNSSGAADGMLRSFYVPPMEQVEMAGKTFFIFEAQGQRYVDRAELDKFNLPENLRGARARLFWAIGADTPFPFTRDPLRKNVQLIHVAYACLSATGSATAEFREKLLSIRFGL